MTARSTPYPPGSPGQDGDPWAVRLLAAKTIALSRLIQFCVNQKATVDIQVEQDKHATAPPRPGQSGAVYRQDPNALPGPGAPAWN